MRASQVVKVRVSLAGIKRLRPSLGVAVIMKLAGPVSAGSIALGKMYGQSETSIFSGGGGAKYRIITVDGVGERGGSSFGAHKP